MLYIRKAHEHDQLSTPSKLKYSLRLPILCLVSLLYVFRVARAATQQPRLFLHAIIPQQLGIAGTGNVSKMYFVMHVFELFYLPANSRKNLLSALESTDLGAPEKIRSRPVSPFSAAPELTTASNKTQGNEQLKADSEKYLLFRKGWNFSCFMGWRRNVMALSQMKETNQLDLLETFFLGQRNFVMALM